MKLPQLIPLSQRNAQIQQASYAKHYARWAEAIKRVRHLAEALEIEPDRVLGCSNQYGHRPLSEHNDKMQTWKTIWMRPNNNGSSQLIEIHCGAFGIAYAVISSWNREKSRWMCKAIVSLRHPQRIVDIVAGL